jgi:glutamyl-tRNA reductase
MKILSLEENDTENRIEEDLKNFMKKLNTYFYKNIVSELKQKMEEGDDNAFLEYSDIIKLAKKHNIK